MKGRLYLSVMWLLSRLLIILLFLLLQVTLNSLRIQHAVQCLGRALCVLLQLLSSFYTQKWNKNSPHVPTQLKKSLKKLNIHNCFIYSRTIYCIVTFSYQKYFWICVKLRFVCNYSQIIKFVKHGLSSDADCSSAVQKTDPFFGTGRFVAVCTRIRYWYLPWAW
jgi:hypothetical protein